MNATPIGNSEQYSKHCSQTGIGNNSQNGCFTAFVNFVGLTQSVGQAYYSQLNTVVHHIYAHLLLNAGIDMVFNPQMA